MSQEQGRFVWYDLMTTDAEGAQSFYTKIVGWGAQPWDGPMPYTMWTRGGAPGGGFMTLTEEFQNAGMPPHWLGYVMTPDVAKTLDTAGANGGKVLSPATDIPDVGCFGVLTDPQGAIFAVFSPAGEPPGHGGPPDLGDFSWHELATTDYEAAWGFYETLFGWTKHEAMDMGEGMMYQMFGVEGVEMPVGGMFNKPADMPGPPGWLFYARVEDVHASVDQVTEAGGKLLNGPMEVPGGDHVAMFLDPQGAAFALHSMKK